MNNKNFQMCLSKNHENTYRIYNNYNDFNQVFLKNENELNLPKGNLYFLKIISDQIEIQI